MLLVIFGAGASYDSVYHHPPPEAHVERVQRFGAYEEFRPPLANQLFDDRPLFVQIMQDYAACMPLVNLLRGDVRVEQQLAKFEEQAKTFPTRKRQLTSIRYYLHHVLWRCQAFWASERKGITNHPDLLGCDLKGGDIEGGASMPRDLQLRHDARRSNAATLGLEYTNLNAYTSRSEYKLIKLHGSVDWGLEMLSVPGRGQPTEVIDSAVRGLTIISPIPTER